MSQFIIDLPSHISSDEARLLLSIKLYEAERLSLDEAAELAGYSKHDFTAMLAKEGIPVTDTSSKDVGREETVHSEREDVRGSVNRYDRPTDPVAQDDWNARR